jgi:hypothetical protein
VSKLDCAALSALMPLISVTRWSRVGGWLIDELIYDDDYFFSSLLLYSPSSWRRIDRSSRGSERKRERQREILTDNSNQPGPIRTLLPLPLIPSAGYPALCHLRPRCCAAVPSLALIYCLHCALPRLALPVRYCTYICTYIHTYIQHSTVTSIYY